MIVRWGLDSLRGVLAEVEIERPLLISTERWRGLDLPVADRFHGARPHAEQEGVRAALRRATEADGLLALGGGSTIDTAKAVSAEMGLRLVSVPTTYAGAEWTDYFGVRDAVRRVKGGGGGARLAGIVYEPSLTLGLPRAESAGTAMNALAHCAEALYVRNRNDEADRHALAGAALIADFLPRVLADGDDLAIRTGLLEGAAEAGAALAGSGLALAHSMAQALGGRFGLPHGALNAICLAPALRFNEPAVPEAVAAFASVIGTDDAAAGVEELARLGGFERLRDLGVPEGELANVAVETAARPGMRLNPRPARPDEIAALLRSVW